MSRTLPPLALAAVLAGAPVFADAPNVAVDIAPVHALVARVMEGIGEPHLILPPGASPHGYSLRPSEAAALQDADLVIWIGEGLTPWMEHPVETLAGNATVITLLEAPETNLLAFREGALFETHAHGDEAPEGAHEDHDEDDDEHDHDHEEHDASDHDDHHGAHDPHAWLSPVNAAAWLDLIAADLANADPDNADTYLANAAAGRAEIDALTTEVNDILAPVRGGRFVVFHDAYQYFEHAFDIPAAGAISLGDATAPSPARIAEIQARVRGDGADCVLTEPQYNPGLVATVLDGTGATTGVIDPLGTDLTPGPDLYAELIREMATTLADCL